MITRDSIKATGAFHLEIYQGDTLIETISEKNLVVTLGKKNMARLFGGHADGKKVEKISVGTNVQDPVVTDTAITGAFTKSIDTVTYPDDQSVQFNFDIANGEANGMTIREFGLLNTDNVLCARKVRAGEIIKTSAIRLVGTWKITFN